LDFELYDAVVVIYVQLTVSLVFPFATALPFKKIGWLLPRACLAQDLSELELNFLLDIIMK